VCRAVAEEDDERARQALATGQNPDRSLLPGVKVATPSSNVLRSSSKGGDLDVVAVPYVFRYLCAELAAMGIAISLEVQ
jgi:DNA-directed RNA polymerase I subunit RPA2